LHHGTLQLGFIAALQSVTDYRGSQHADGKREAMSKFDPLLRMAFDEEESCSSYI
jgi:hypothetical protein